MLQDMQNGTSPRDEAGVLKTTAHEREGRIELIIGPMFAGKTTELMRRVKREIHACRTCFVIKYARDTRYDPDNIVSHDNVRLRARAVVSTLSEVGSMWSQFDVIAIDEGQFFPDIVDFCRTAADAGRIVMVSALDGDYLCRPFGDICRLLPLCESVTKLTAVCMLCLDRHASFTRRTVDNVEQELIGGAEMYIATCRRCYNLPGPISHTMMRHRQAAIRQVEEACLGSAERDGSGARHRPCTYSGEACKPQESTAPSTIAASPVSPVCGAGAAGPRTALRWSSEQEDEKVTPRTGRRRDSAAMGRASLLKGKPDTSEEEEDDDEAGDAERAEGLMMGKEGQRGTTGGGQKRFVRESSSPSVYVPMGAATGVMAAESEGVAKMARMEA